MTSPPKQKIRRHSKYQDSLVEDCAENGASLEDENLNSQIEIPYDILTVVFKTLNAKDLCNAAQVCRCWSDVASIEKRLRVPSPLVMLGNLLNSWEDLSPEKPLIDNMVTKPMFGFVFADYIISTNPALIKKDDCPCRMLPSGCPLVKIGSIGVVKDNLETRGSKKAVFLLLPYDKEVTIETVYAPRDPPSQLDPKKSAIFADIQSEHDDCAIPCPKEEPYRILQKYPYAENKIKCFVLFSDEDLSCAADILDVVPRGNRRAIAGCKIPDLTICDKNGEKGSCNERLGWVVLLISGPHVKSWTAVLPYALRTKETVTEKLQKLRQKVSLQKISVGFMFACEGRGEQMFREPNVEASIFKEIFPEVPLLGCSGVGEYGDCSVKRMPRLDHQYSTVFMILTYGQVPKNPEKK